MLNKLNNDNIVILLLSSIIFNYFLLFSSSLILLVKLNLLLFFFLNFIFFYKLNKNIFLLLIIITLLIICLGSLTNQWDARSLWLFKAKRIYLDLSVISIKDNYAIFSHPDYPNIGPAFIAGFSKCFGFWNEIYPKVALTLMFIPALILLNKYFYNNNFLLVMFLILFTIGKFLVNGEMDGLVSIYFTVSFLVIYNLSLKDSSKKNDFILAILLIIILSMLKIEGFILSLIIIFTVTTFMIAKKKINYQIVFCLSLAIMPAIIWQIFTTAVNINNASSPYNYNLDDFSLRFLQVENYFLISKYMILNDKFFFSIIFFIITYLYTKNKNILKYVVSLIFIYMSILYIVYLSTPLDLEWHLNSSATRVVKPMALFLFILGVYNINYKNKIY